VDVNPYELKKKLLLAQDKQWDIVWQVAVHRVHVDVLEKLWGWAKQQQLNLSELKNKLFPALDKLQKTAWELETDTGNVDVDYSMLMQSQ